MMGEQVVVPRHMMRPLGWGRESKVVGSGLHWDAMHTLQGK